MCDITVLSHSYTLNHCFFFIAQMHFLLDQATSLSAFTVYFSNYVHPVFQHAHVQLYSK